MKFLIKKRIAGFLRKMVDKLDPQMEEKVEEPENPFISLVDVVVEPPSKLQKETLKVAELLRDGELRRLHEIATGLFLIEDSLRTEEDYWKLTWVQRGRFLERAIAISIATNDAQKEVNQ